MTSDEVIRMAQEAGYHVYDLTETHGKWTVETDEADELAQLERFAKLIRDDYSNKHAQLWLKRIDEAVKAERKEIVAEFLKRHKGVSHRNNYWHHAANYVQARDTDAP